VIRHTADPKLKPAAGKPPLQLLEPAFLVAVADAMGTGFQNYGQRSYVTPGNRYMTYLGAAMRHLMAWAAGEDIDPDSGLPHLAHAGASVMILYTLTRYPHAVDDRLDIYVGEG
jgi:hypothetical protein